MLAKKEYAYTAGSHTEIIPTSAIVYSDGDTNWKDRLIEYSGKAITYDAIGNPLTYDGFGNPTTITLKGN